MTRWHWVGLVALIGGLVGAVLTWRGAVGWLGGLMFAYAHSAWMDKQYRVLR